MPDTILQDILGRVIVLHERTWTGHVLRRHPELAPHRGLVEQAVRQPMVVRRSLSSADCRLYFAPGPRAGVFIVAVVDVNLGLVKTAHLAKVLSGGAQEWP